MSVSGTETEDTILSEPAEKSKVTPMDLTENETHFHV